MTDSIVELASNVFDLRKGQTVLLPDVLSSNSWGDDRILVGWTNVSQNGERMQKLYKDGAWAEKLLVPASALFPIPDALTSEYSTAQLGVLGYFGIGYGAVLRGDLKPGQVVVINGATGCIGTSALLFALAMGASRIIAVGRDEETLKELQTLDPKRVFPVALGNNIQEDTQRIAKIASEGDHPRHQGAHLVIDAVGGVHVTAESTLACIASLRNRGVVSFVGGISVPLPLNYRELFIAKTLDLRGSFMLDSLDSFGDIVRMIASGVLDIGKLRVHAFPLAQINEAVAEAAKYKGLDWAVVEPNK